jgi:phosphatidylglycerophosphate synthase
LRKAGARPNQVSLVGLGFAVLAAICLIVAGGGTGDRRIALLLAAALLMPLRLLCNLFDGMLAVEGGQKTTTGEIYNELPDRLSDLAILAAAGYAMPAVVWGRDLGWAAGAAALLTAYVRTLGVAAGAAPHFNGPMAKPRRMHVMIVACLLSAAETALGWPQGRLLAAALVVIVGGCAVTILRRLRRIAADLRAP